MKHVSLDLHDWSILRSRMDLLEEIKSHYPNFKVSLFTIPFDYEYETTNLRLNKDQIKERVNRNLDWMQFIPHGITHVPQEFEKCDRHTMKMYLDNIENEMNNQGFSIEEGFCAPQWLWNQEVVDVLNEYGWWGATDKNQPQMLKPKRFYTYSHSIAEPFWESTNEVLKLHGHMTLPSKNSLDLCLTNLLKLPSDVEWHFVTDFIETQ